MKYSPSMLKTFMLCPFKFYLEYIKREKDSTYNPAKERGLKEHKQAENFLKTKDFSFIENLPSLHFLNQDKFKNNVIGIEERISVNENFELTEWNSEETKYRCIADAILKIDNKLFIIDYKTGKKVNDETIQATFLEKLAKAKYGNLECKCIFIYVNINEIRTYENTDFNYVLDIIKKIENKNFNKNFINNFCGIYCNHTDCDNCKKDEEIKEGVEHKKWF